MANSGAMLCDGCGQPASSEHIAKRLQRLEWTTRYRPIHIGAVLLGAVSPQEDADFLYAPTGEFAGEAQRVLAATGISNTGKSTDAVLSEFQRGGLLLTYVLECPLEPSANNPESLQGLLQYRVPSLLARIRRSLRPKRLALISRGLEPLLPSLQNADLGCTILLDGGKAFALDGGDPDSATGRLHQSLSAVAATSR